MPKARKMARTAGSGRAAAACGTARSVTLTKRLPNEACHLRRCKKRLLDIWYDARTLEEEQGVNILYLGLGLLKWFEDDKSDCRSDSLRSSCYQFDLGTQQRCWIGSTSCRDRSHLRPICRYKAKMTENLVSRIDDFG